MPSYISRKKLKQDSKPSKFTRIKKWFSRFFITLGILMFISLVLSIVSLVTFFGGGEKHKSLPDEFILGIGLYGTMSDVSDQNSLIAQFIPPEPSLLDFIRSLNFAKTDDRVKAVAVRIYDGDYSLTQIETIREAIIDFRKIGKKAYIYTDSFGGFSNGMGEYWLSTAFDEIWVQPVGLVSLSGIRIEQPYFNETLEKIGVEMEMEQRKEFKTAPEMYLRNSMSDESAITLKAIMTDIMDTMIGQIATSRENVDTNVIKRAIDNSPLLVEEALSMNLIDKVGYIDEFENLIKANIKAENNNLDDDYPQSNLNDYEFVSLDRYKFESAKNRSKDEIVQVAMVKVEGAILETPPNADLNGPKALLVPNDIADARDIAASIRAASDDQNIKVIIIRINSPGGSPGASETIRRAIVQAKEKGKFIIASMADTAASGGYWIAVDADVIIAAKLTLTGSIGVYGGKPNLNELWNKIGVNWQAIEYGDNASMWSTNVGYNDSTRERLDAMMDRIYTAFTERVSEGREMSLSEVEKVAKGRVWTGIDAKAHKLIDEIGGFEKALELAANKAEIKNWQTMPIAVLPKHDDTFADLAKMIGIPVQINVPSLPQTFVPSFYPEAIVTAPPLKIDF